MLRLFPRALRELACSTAPYELKPCNDDDDEQQLQQAPAPVAPAPKRVKVELHL